MRRADRLLQIIQIMRRKRGVVTAHDIAEEAEVSLRTVYRDIATLQSTGVPVRGEAGFGYVLDEGYDLPPLMFTPSELEAIMLGARMVEARGDADLIRATHDVVAKISAILPEELRPHFIDAPLYAPSYCAPLPEPIPIANLRAAIHARYKVDMTYHDQNGAESRRRIWPLSLAYFEQSRVLICWCELRNDFRHFRADRIAKFEPCDEKYREHRAVMIARWKASQGY